MVLSTFNFWGVLSTFNFWGFCGSGRGGIGGGLWPVSGFPILLLVSPGMVCYAGKQEKPFWFSSLDQIVQFGAIIFCRTFKNYFGHFVWIEKKATIIVAFHNFMKRRLKTERIKF